MTRAALIGLLWLVLQPGCGGDIGDKTTVAMRHPCHEYNVAAMPQVGQEATLSLHPKNTIVVSGRPRARVAPF